MLQAELDRISHLVIRDSRQVGQGVALPVAHFLHLIQVLPQVHAAGQVVVTHSHTREVVVHIATGLAA